MSDELDSSQGLGARVKRGLAWSAASAIVLRLGTLSVGIVVARLLAPADFGVYAIALTTQSILLALADLGLSADLIRARNPKERAPTIASLSLLSGVGLCLLMSLTSVPVAVALGSREAAPVIVVLSFTLIVASAGVTPYAKLMRGIQQKKLFATSVIDFVLGTTVTLVLIAAGWGPMALAVSRLVAQTGATAAQFMLARVRPHFGFDREIAMTGLRFGLPLAAANLLSWALLNVDRVVIARMSGEVALGFYVLAFNVASWPMTAIGQTVRSVSLAAFSRLQRDEATDQSREVKRDKGFAVGLGYAWVAAVPAGALLAILSFPLIILLYGAKWTPSAPVLAALGTFGALRVGFDLAATYLIARGASRAVLWIQAGWIVGLVPVMLIGIQLGGLPGAGWAHVAVGVLVVAPAYLIAVMRAGADLREVGAVIWPPLAGAVPAVIAATVVSRAFDGTVPSLLLGGSAGSIIYLALMVPWLRRLQAKRANLSLDEGDVLPNTVDRLIDDEQMPPVAAQTEVKLP